MPNIKYDLNILRNQFCRQTNGSLSFRTSIRSEYNFWAIAARSEQSPRSPTAIRRRRRKIILLPMHELQRCYAYVNNQSDSQAPWARAIYGEELVKTCAETGTDYCDITGETHWIKEMLLRYERVPKNGEDS